ncbi:MAG: D-alanine--D-alanine ligase family protein [Longimicrobiales bacterium]
MKITLLHGSDALEPPPDPVLDQVAGALVASGHLVHRLAVGNAIEPIIGALREEAPDLVFNLTESFDGKSALDSSIASLLNLIGLRYTGSSPAGLMLAGDKSLTKKVLGFHGIRTPEFATLYRGALDHAGDLKFPLIVKPPQEDASMGITESSVVSDLRELLQRMDDLQTTYQQPVLIEQFIPGREFYVAILGNANAAALPVVELDFSRDAANRYRIASYEVKWAEDEAISAAESIIAENLPPELDAEMKRIALEAFQALRLRDYARIDMRVSEAGEVFVIEVNPNCYLEQESEFAMAASAGGIAFGDLVNRIAELATARYSR